MTNTLNTSSSENTMVLSEGEDFCMHVFSSTIYDLPEMCGGWASHLFSLRQIQVE
jgi:hypothetical protein